MRTRNSYYPNNSPVTILRRQNRRRAPIIVEHELRTIVEVASMEDNRTMDELLQVPTEGYGEAIVIPEILAENFKIKTNLLQLVQANKFHGFERDNPHTHIANFKRMTATLKYRDVPNDVIKLMLFPYSLEGAARIWYEKEPPNSILTWDDLVNKFVEFKFPSSRHSLKNEIMDVCHALADLGASINLMPFSIWKKLSLPELTPTRMTLELADRSITSLMGVAEDVFVKVGKFHFPTDFVVVDFDADPRVPLILERSFWRTGCALIDVYGEEITLRVNDEAVTFNLNQTTRYSSTYNDMSVNRIDVIDVACEEYAQEVLGFSNNFMGGNPTPTSEPIISDSYLSLTPFEGSDFILEEVEAYLKDNSISPEIDHADLDLEGDIRLTSDALLEKLTDELALLKPFPLRIGDDDFDPEGDILLLEKLLNDDPSSPLSPKELNFKKLKMIKSSIDDFSSVNVYEEKSVTFSNPLFDSNDDFTSSDDESLSDEDALEDIESKDSYVSNLDESALLVTPLFDANEDECFDPGGVIDEIDAFLDMDISTYIKIKGYHDSEGIQSILRVLLMDDTIPNLSRGFLKSCPRSFKG
ncbi:reverse transcriptase domain-containing protein [Tanacetum coccineum]